MTVFAVEPECRELGLVAGAIVFRDVSIGDAPRELRDSMASESTRVAEEFPTAADLRALPEIAAHHELLRSVGVKPRRRPPSTEKLLELARSGRGLPAINNLVDAYNLVSIRTRCSLGAHDLDRFTPPATLRLLRGDERFRPLGSDEDQPTKAGEFAYVDAANRVLCRLDSLQADFSKVTAATKNALLIVEATTRHAPEQVAAAFEEVAQLVTQYCGGTSAVLVRPA
ncbi:MAG: hypothetical protein DWQ42_15835 [Planctomycetota bacterium]|nr:MAG: hypothetical protein DWQ42_15835 [Planctomycetota bacterium]REK38373.1 MAG: hypothetical protein DWQ46_20660 [Planctomycetota bacterium]